MSVADSFDRQLQSTFKHPGESLRASHTNGQHCAQQHNQELIATSRPTPPAHPPKSQGKLNDKGLQKQQAQHVKSTALELAILSRNGN
jgi:hypothetical protein